MESSNDVIKQNVLRLQQANASPVDIENYVKLATQERNSQSLNQQTTQQPQSQQQGFSYLKDITASGVPQQAPGIVSGIFQSTLGSQGLAGVAQMPGRVAADYLASQGAQQDFSKAQQYADQAANLKLQAKNTIDPIKKQQLLNQASSYDTLYQSNLGSGNVNQQFNYTPSQALGTTLNAGLTALTGSDIGGNGLLKSAAEKSLINSSVPLSTISTIGKAVTSTPARLAENAALGIAYNTASNLNQNQDPFNGWKTAAFFGAVVPEAIRGSSKVMNAIQTGAQEAGKGLINSLIKPLQKNFAYSKDPARGILAEGIKANSLDDFGNKVDQALTKRVQQSRQIGQQVSNRLGSSLDFSGAVNPIDKAIDKAAQMNNTTLFNSLQDVKTALTTQLGKGIDEKGNPTIVKIGEKQLTNRTYDQGLDFLHDIAAHTRYTGNPSDDKALNQATQQAYRYVRSKLNEAAQKAGFGKQSVVLNERISDLISAQSAIAHRELINQRSNVLDLTTKLGFTGGALWGIVHGISTGDWVGAAKILTADLVAAGAAKAVGSTAVKTRVAQFLNGLGPVERQSILNSTPALKNWYERLTGNKAPTNPDAEKTLPLKIATEPVQTAKDFASKMAEFLPFLKLGKKAAEKAGMGEEYKALLVEVENSNLSKAIVPETANVSQMSDVLNNASKFRSLPKGSNIDNPNQIFTLGGNVSISNKTIKHIVEQRNVDAQSLIKEIPLVLSKPTKIVDNSVKRPDSFLYARMNGKARATVLEITKTPDGSHQVVSAFPVDTKTYNKLIDISGRSDVPSLDISPVESDVSTALKTKS